MSPFDQLPTPTHPETKAGDDAGAPTLHAVFIADERPAYLGLYTGARCVLPTGDVVELRHKRTPLYDLARELVPNTGRKFRTFSGKSFPLCWR